MFREGQQIGGYTLIKRIGRGGFGEVWLAERRTALLTTKVAVKLPHDSLVNLETVRQEAVLWEQASGHPNVLPIIEANIYDEQVVFISEYAPDGSLADLLKREGQISIEDAVRFTIGITAGLEFLHSRRIIHRDLKPANILLQGETPRLADFGISHALQTSVSSQSQNIKGTFSYMPPEAFDGKRNEQTDIWSVGVILYQMLRGLLPFPQENSTELFGAIVMREPEPLPKEIPAKLKESVAKCLAKLPENRYQSAKDLRLDLEKILVGISHPSFAETEVLGKVDFETIEDIETDTEIESDGSPKPVRETDDVAETIESEEPQPESEIRKTLPSTVQHLVDKKLKKREPLQTFIATTLVVLFVIVGIFTVYGILKVITTDFSNTNQDTNQKQSKNTNPNNRRDANSILQDHVNAIKNMPNNNTSDTPAPKTAADYLGVGNGYYYSKDYDLAIASYSKCIEFSFIDSDSIKAKCYNGRGMSYNERGDFDKAIDDHTKAIELKPSSWNYFQRGKSFMGKLMYPKAIADLNQAISQGASADAYVLRGDAYYKMTGFPTPSIGDYCKALKLDKDNEGAKQGLARVPNAKCP